MRNLGQGGGTTTSSIRSLFLKHRGVLSLEEVAKKLCVSPRTLRRRLADEGSQYQVLADNFRNDLSKEYIDTGLIPIKEIAYRLGFSRPDAFSRAFKSWNGITVNEYKNRSKT